MRAVLVLVVVVLSGCVYSPKNYEIERLIECPVEGFGGVT